ncbi:MAG: PIN domain-containing protein [Rhizobiaceae bacterium]
MTKIYDATAGCPFATRTFLLDTNVWIYIDGGDPRPHFAAYSDFYGSLRRSDNVIVVNDYVLGEFFNRACRTAYSFLFDDDPEMRLLKSRRRNDADFRMQVETVRDTCLNILDECKYEPAPVPSNVYHALLTEAAQGHLDLSDLVIREHCKVQGHILVTHDADYANCGLEVVTTNKKLLGMP